MALTHAGVPADSGAANGWNAAFDKLASQLRARLRVSLAGR
jgi:hypothetical protein